MTELELMRHNHLVDPQLQIWGWQIPVYLFLGGLTAGVMILSAIASRRIARDEMSKWLRWMPFASPILLSIGMFALLLDLEYKLHVFRFYTTFRITSPMSWGSWILLLIYPATILLGVSRLTHGELDALVRRLPKRIASAAGLVHELSTRRTRGLEMWNIGLGIALGAYTGILLGSLGARALWSSPLLGPLFLVSGISTGAALMMLFPISDPEHHLVRNWDVAAIAAELSLLALFFLGLRTNSGANGKNALDLFLGGPYTAAFWSLVVIAGIAIPLFLEAWESKRAVRATVAGPLLLLAGGFMLRWILVAAGQV